MADEKNEAQEVVEETEESRREFLGKAASAVGTLGIAGVLAGLFGSEADAQLRPTAGGVRAIEGLNLSTQKLGDARTFTLSGKNLAAALGREGMIPGADRAAEAGLSLTVKG